jgi:hypothetical protein
LRDTRRLVLQANGPAGDLRRWLGANGWALIHEVSVLDDDRWYVVDVAIPAPSTAVEPAWRTGLGRVEELGGGDEWPWRLCPVLIGARSRQALGVVETQLSWTRGALHDAGSHDTLRARDARSELSKDVRELEAVVRWLSEDVTS